MLVYELVNTEVLPLKVADSAEDAIKAMDRYGMSSMPIVDHTTRKFLGMITRTQILDNRESSPSSIRDNALVLPTLDPDTHIFDAIRYLIKHDQELLPVVDQKKTFIGVILREDLLDALVKIINIREQGTTLLIEVEQRDFTLSEMIRLIESENAKILGLTVQPPRHEYEPFRISLKLNLIDAKHVTASLDRHGFTVSSQTEEYSFNHDYEERADELIHFLNL